MEGIDKAVELGYNPVKVRLKLLFFFKDVLPIHPD